MFSLKRNQIIITALVVMICVAGYLNYIDSRNGIEVSEGYDMTPGGEISAIILDGTTGQEVSVVGTGNGAVVDYETVIALYNNEDNDEDNQSDSNANETEPGTAVFVNATSDSSFFVQAKLDREQDRARQKETLTALINSEEVDKTTKAQCADAILEISNRMEKESAAEAMLGAKGFGDTYVRIDDEWVEVIINKSALSDQELAQLEDIIKRTTGATVDKIRVSSVK